MNTNTKFSAMTGLLLTASFLCSGTEFRVNPDDDSFEQAAKNWKKGDTILLAPGTYYTRFQTGAKDAPPPCGLTIKAEIPGTAIFRGDRKAPAFQKHSKGIWKTQWESIPETVFERDNLVIYKYCATLSGLQQRCAAWTYDAKSKTLYVRTSDSGDPARHVLSIGVTPWSGINFYCSPASTGVQDVLLEGFLTTGYYSRLKYPDLRLPHTQRKVAWGVVISHPTKNVTIRNVGAVLNGYGVGICSGAADTVIENCRAFGNRNPFDHSGGGIGIFDGAENCVIRGNFGSDNKGQDIYVYSGTVKKSTVFEENNCFGMIRLKAGKEDGFAMRNCVSNTIGHVIRADHAVNCVTLGYNQNPDVLKRYSLMMNYEKELNADKIFADPVNFDCRMQAGVPEAVAKRGIALGTEHLFYWKQNGNDAADGRSVENAFGSSVRVLQELATPGTEIYIAGPVEGDLHLKDLKDVTIRGRGAFPVAINGKITLENCNGVKLERLAPAEFIVQGGSGISITQSAGKISADHVSGLRLTHSYVPQFTLRESTNCFITANVFEQADVDRIDGWSDYNAYAEQVPAGEKNSFVAKAKLGKDFTFKNAWQFNGRAIDAMPVGPYRRQQRDVKLLLDAPEVQCIAPDTALVRLTANIPFDGSLFWGDPAEGGEVRELPLTTESIAHTVALSGLEPGKKYFVELKGRAVVARCFSNAEVKKAVYRRKGKTDRIEFTTPAEYAEPRQYFVSKEGDDSNAGSEEKPFGTIGYAVTKLRPGDTLTIRGGTYEENFTVPVSGTKERPVVIRGAPGERVFIQGGFGAPLEGGITITNQNYVHFQDFCIYGNHTVPEGFSQYTIRAVNCRGLLFQRMVISGSGHKLHAINCDDLRIEDCGFSYGHEGVFLSRCGETSIRNCTFAHAALMHLMIRDERGPVTVENCIFTDALNKKGAIAVISISDIANLKERNNCFFTRIPFDQKPLIGWNKYDGVPAVRNVNPGIVYTGLRQQPYPAYLKDTHREDTGSFSANPGIPAFPDYVLKYESFDAWKKTWKENDVKGGLEAQRVRDNPELLRDLKYFLPTNPEVIKRGCGPRIK